MWKSYLACRALRPRTRIAGCVHGCMWAEHTHRLFHALDNHPQTTSMQRMGVDLLPAVTGMFCLMAHEHGHPESRLLTFQEILMETSDRLEGWDHGVVPYTERSRMGELHDGLRARLREVRMGLSLTPDVEFQGSLNRSRF